MSSRKRHRRESEKDDVKDDRCHVQPEEVALMVHRYLSKSCPETAKSFQKECPLLHAFFLEESVAVKIPPMIDLNDMMNEFVELKQQCDNRKVVTDISEGFHMPNNYADPRTALMQQTLQGVYSLLEQYQQNLNRPAVDQLVPEQVLPSQSHQSTLTVPSSRKRKSQTPVRTVRETYEEIDLSGPIRSVSQVFPLDDNMLQSPIDFQHRVQIDATELANNNEFVNMLVENINQHRSSFGQSPTNIESEGHMSDTLNLYDSFPPDLLDQMMPLMANAIDELPSPMQSSPSPVPVAAPRALNTIASRGPLTFKVDSFIAPSSRILEAASTHPSTHPSPRSSSSSSSPRGNGNQKPKDQVDMMLAKLDDQHVDSLLATIHK